MMNPEIKIQCPLCHIPMQFKVINNLRRQNGKQVMMQCPKCRNDLKLALKQKLAKI